MTLGVMLGPTCNHDLGVLLRLGKLSGCNGSLEHVDKQAALASMMDAMGDHEYYCASYSSKDQPHVDGLLCTLADSLRHKENDIAAAKESLTQAAQSSAAVIATQAELTAHEAARGTLHRLMAATNRRMQRGFLRC